MTEEVRLREGGPKVWELDRLRQHSDWQTEVVAQHERTMTELSRQVGLAQTQAADARAVADELRCEVERLRDEATDLLAENARLRAQVEQFETSTIWRATRPLRTAADRAKRTPGV